MPEARLQRTREAYKPISCPFCGGLNVTHDTWEDCYVCHNQDCTGPLALAPEQVGQRSNPKAGIYHIGEPGYGAGV